MKQEKDCKGAILFIVFLLLMIGFANRVYSQDVFTASRLLNKDIIYLSSYEGKLKENSIISAEFLLQKNKMYQILKLIYIKEELISEESIIINTCKEEVLNIKLKYNDKKKATYFIILGYGGNY